MYIVDPMDSQHLIYKGPDYIAYDLRPLFFPEWSTDFV